MNQKDYIFFFLILVLVVYIYSLHQDKASRDYEYNKKVQVLKIMNDEYKNKMSCGKTNCTATVTVKKPLNTGDLLTKRDIAVVHNPLYPPLDRNSRPLADDYLAYRQAGLFDYPTRTGSDTYRLMGYLISSTDKNDKWNIYGRQKHSGSSQGEFYATQQCNNNSCTKIELTKDILAGEKLNDFYNLPSVLTFTSPLFSTDPYNVVQLNISNGYSPYY